jgi:hypothetical protein
MKKVWSKPELRRLVAGGAEAGPKSGNDSGAGSGQNQKS